ncbi:hypothetical protein Nepgr_010401 [Nepenthes gracilis]|uniref:Uncharacterized protein n=1 Tax=Nepenthes gracilis TaxID=150966 RepID=A0AAD3SD22_NEPGR|nr:hypothetical protein Nepgr_010401 [Nepenthes gracilis]
MAKLAKLLSPRLQFGAFLHYTRPSSEDVVASRAFNGKLDPIKWTSSQVPRSRTSHGAALRASRVFRPWQPNSESRPFIMRYPRFCGRKLGASTAPGPNVLTAWVVWREAKVAGCWDAVESKSECVRFRTARRMVEARTRPLMGHLARGQVFWIALGHLMEGGGFEVPRPHFTDVGGVPRPKDQFSVLGAQLVLSILEDCGDEEWALPPRGEFLPARDFFRHLYAPEDRISNIKRVGFYPLIVVLRDTLLISRGPPAGYVLNFWKYATDVWTSLMSRSVQYLVNHLPVNWVPLSVTMTSGILKWQTMF